MTPLLPPVYELRKATELLVEWLLRLDQPLDAQQLLRALPYVLEQEGGVLEMQRLVDGCVRHLATPRAYAEFYDTIWEAEPPRTYGAVLAAGSIPRVQWVARQVHAMGAKRVIDLGCGNGFLPLYLATFGIEAVGINLTTRAATAAQAVADALKLPATFRADAAECTTAPDHAFDVVVAMEIVEHVTSPCELVHEMERLARRGGVCMMTTPNGSSTYGEDTWAERDRNGGKLGDPLAHVRVYTPTSMGKWLGNRSQYECTVGPGPAQGSLHVRWLAEEAR